jgi:hypothetical protein
MVVYGDFFSVYKIFFLWKTVEYYKKELTTTRLASAMPFGKAPIIRDI